MKNYCVMFAGAIGSSKTPIAHHLSCNFNLPIHSNDCIRTEVAEDLMRYDQEEYKKRVATRIENMLNNKVSFIYDASVDRQWVEIKEMLTINDYEYFIISLDLSKEFLLDLYHLKGYTESVKQIDRLLKEHDDFLTKHSGNVNLHITNDNFKDRLELSSKMLANGLAQFD